jgi:putative tricarboxylic transport membrane protein
MKRGLLLVCAVVIAIGLPATARAQGEVKARLQALKPPDYPTQPIELVVVYPAGGGMDVTARLLAKYVEKYTDHRMIVVNKTGGGGFIGHSYLATSAKNDGYTVGILSGSLWTDEMMRAKGRWSHRDLTPIAFVNYDLTTWIVSTDGPFKDRSLKDVVALAKAKPGSVRAAIVPDMAFQFLAESVEMATGARLVKVPFQGGAPGITALLGGHVEIATGFLTEYRGQLEAGKVKVIAVAGHERSPYFPSVPTFNEALGTDSLVWPAWRFAAVPKGTPPERARYLEAAIDAALHDQDLVEEYRKTGVIAGVKYLTAKETTEQVERLYGLDREFFTKTGRIGR